MKRYTLRRRKGRPLSKAARVREQLRVRRAGIETLLLGSLVLFVTPTRTVLAHLDWDARDLAACRRSTSRAVQWRVARETRAA